MASLQNLGVYSGLEFSQRDKKGLAWYLGTNHFQHAESFDKTRLILPRNAVPDGRSPSRSGAVPAS
jgi:hypothetical protein